MGASRQAAAAWRELAEVFSSLGRMPEALDAYRRATDAASIAVPIDLIPVLERSRR